MIRHTITAGRRSDGLEGEAVLDLCIAKDGTPVYVQVKRQILEAIGRGELRPGSRMPTARDLSVQIRASVNTIRAAYDDLAREEVLVVQAGRGTFVADVPLDIDPALAKAEVESLARRTVASARAAGLSPGLVGLRIVEISEQTSDNIEKDT